jgi:hypothetical protein
VEGIDIHKSINFKSCLATPSRIFMGLCEGFGGTIGAVIAL